MALLDEATNATNNTDANVDAKTQEANVNVDANKTATATDKANTPNVDAGKKVDVIEDKAPEKYEDFKLGDGMTINEGILTKFTGVAKELNLSQAKAQKVVELAAEHAKALIESQSSAYQKVREGWVNEIKTDKEFGGQKFSETLERAGRALKRFSNDGFKRYLGESGMGDNPELIKMLAKIDRATSEDRSVDNQTVGGSEMSVEDVMYPSQKK